MEVKLTNWRPFELTDPPVQFTPGINFIYGENGAGKSSFLDAIMYGLYGELPYNLEYAVRRGRTYARVVVKFRGQDGKAYTVQRVIRERVSKDGKKTVTTSHSETKFFYPDGTSIVGPEEVTKEVAGKLGVSSRIFSETLYLRQGELRDIIIKAGRDRAKYLDNLIGTIDLERCYNACAELVSWSNGIRMELEGRSRTLELMVSELPVLREEANKTRGEIRVLDLNVTALKEAKEDINREREKLEDVKEELENNRNALKLSETKLKAALKELSSLQTLLSEIETARKEVGKIAGELLKTGKLKRDVASLRRERSKLVKGFVDPDELRLRIENVKNDIRSRQSRVSRLQRRKDQLESILRATESLGEVDEEWAKENKHYLETRDAFSSLSSELASLENNLEALVKYKGGKCPTCLQEIRAEYFDKVSSNLRRTIELRRKEMEEKKELLEKLEESVNELEKKRDELRALSSRIGDLKADVELLEEEVRDLERIETDLGRLTKQLAEAESRRKRIEELDQEVEAAEKELRKLEGLRGQMKELEKRVNQRPEVEKKMQDVEAEIKELEDECEKQRQIVYRLSEEMDEKRLSELTKLAKKTEEDLMDAIGRVEELSGQLKEKERRITELEEEHRKLDEAKKGLTKWQTISDLIGRIRQAFRGAQPILRQQFLDSINVEAQQIFLDIRRKKRLESLEITGDYEINVVEAGQRFPVEAYSGGEKTLIAIVFRTALAKALAGEIPLLIYDEPTEYLDRGHRENLVNWLSEWGEIEQVLVVSQLDDFNSVADNFKEIQMREDGTSIVM